VAERADIHGTAIAVAGNAVLIRGRSGAGKSDLALRCLAVPACALAPESPVLVADDRVVAEAGPDGVVVSAPVALRGLIEVRGVGIVPVPSISSARLVLIVDLAWPAEIERLPDALEPAEVCGRPIPRVLVAPFEAAAPLKLLAALGVAVRAGDAH
jgi:serine kinase of HPr protein (carbohydrate metabolism regulator)